MGTALVIGDPAPEVKMVETFPGPDFNTSVLTVMFDMVKAPSDGTVVQVRLSCEVKP